jgi:hypothetical protein
VSSGEDKDRERQGDKQHLMAHQMHGHYPTELQFIKHSAETNNNNNKKNFDFFPLNVQME